MSDDGLWAKTPDFENPGAPVLDDAGRKAPDPEEARHP
jgi:hypothetical protein